MGEGVARGIGQGNWREVGVNIAGDRVETLWSRRQSGENLCFARGAMLKQFGNASQRRIDGVTVCGKKPSGRQDVEAVEALAIGAGAAVGWRNQA